MGVLPPNLASAAGMGGLFQIPPAVLGCRGVFADLWGMPLVIVGLDVAGAFDNCAPKRTAQQPGTRGATPAQVAAVFRETIGARVQPRVGEVRGPWTELATGIRQGAARSPHVWNHAVCGPLEAARRCMDETLGPPVKWSAELSRWGLLLWADNLFFVVDSWNTKRPC